VTTYNQLLPKNLDNEVDTGENFKAVIFNRTAGAGTNQVPEIKVNSNDFVPAQ